MFSNTLIYLEDEALISFTPEVWTGSVKNLPLSFQTEVNNNCPEPLFRIVDYVYIIKNVYDITVITGTSFSVIAQFDLRMVIKTGYLVDTSSLALKIKKKKKY